MSRPASFFRHGLPTETYMHTPAIVVGRQTGAVVTGAYALDAGFWPTAAGGQLNEKPECKSESTHARDRFSAFNLSCSASNVIAVGSSVVAAPPQNITCRFSGVDVMAEQLDAYLKAYNGARAAGTRCIDKSISHNQVSLRYGIDDVVGVTFTKPKHAPVASKLALWLRELTGRNIALISMVEKGKCECMEAVPTAHPLQLARLNATAMSDENNISCAEPCGAGGQPACCIRQCNVPTVDTIALDLRWHAIFLHIPLTGAVVIECATAGWAREGLWTNLGAHVTSFREVQSYMAGCRRPPPDRIVPTLVLTVRNPYDYWWFVYAQKTTQCHGARAMCLAQYNQLMSAKAQSNGNTSFYTFLHSTAGEAATVHSAVSQSGHIRRICGDPCDYTFLLHTETLNADYLSLLAHLNLPVMQGLPRPAHSSLDLSANRALVYTPKLATVVQEMEWLLFEARFGYSRLI
jgi:hypothetical protein